MKICIDCKQEKNKTDFNKHNDRPDKLSDRCRPCTSLQWKERYSGSYGETHRRLAKERYEKKKDIIKKQTNDYYHKNKEAIFKKRLEYQKRKMKEDPKFAMSRRLRNRLYYALQKKSWKKNTKFAEYIGCTLDELKDHIAGLFQPGMTWENMGEWHIDHKIPLNSANTEEELYKLCHYTNLQPLWAKDNLKKGYK